MAEVNYKFHRPDLKDVTVFDSFWAPFIEKIRTVTLIDMLDKFETNGYFNNYDMVARGEKGNHIGPPWSDGLICEIIRAASDFLADSYDETLDKRLDGYIARIAAASEAGGDGFLHTYTMLMCPEHRWAENGGNLRYQHDVYNSGCLTEAGIHHYRATGKTTLLRIAVSAVNYMCAYMGLPPKKNIVPAHSQPEEAVLKLYQLFRDTPQLAEFAAENNCDIEEYKRLALFWIDARGHHETRVSHPKYLGEYAQDHRPISEQHEAVGHAVRAMLFYTGVAAAACDTGRKDYIKSSNKLWDNVVMTKFHIHGGVGAWRHEESFGYQYELPNDAYLETCASVAFAFWAGEMHRLNGDSSYMDYFERAVCNNIMASVSDDGHHYFYENPLISDGNVERWEWHGCPCCPPMLLKIVSAFKSYIWSIGTDESISANMFIDSTLRHGNITVKQNQGAFTIEGTANRELTLKIRVPEYMTNSKVFFNNEEFTDYIILDGYITVSRIWSETDSIRIIGDTPVYRMQAHPYVDSNHGHVSVNRGAFVYCAEGIDNDGDIDITISEKSELAYNETTGNITGITSVGKSFTLIPYYKWNNRGKSKMKVWLRQEGLTENKLNLDGWARKLYRIYKIY